MNNKLIRSIYSVCAAAGFMSALLAPCYSSGGVQFSAAEMINEGSAVYETAVSAADFSDVDTSAWYFPYVDMLVKDGVINGTTEDTYSPDGTFTVAQSCAVITRYLGLESYAYNRRNHLISNGVTGSDLWYSGYVQTLFDIGVLVPEAFGLSAVNGYVAIGSVDQCERPLKRYEFAELITRSFDIDTSVTFAKNIPPEICTNGNSFIIGGKYDETVSLYSGEINDFEQIPEASRENVLKAYYNGIFNGDTSGNFNPGADLKRSEMSKVIAVITDRTLRTRNEYRAVSALCGIPEEKYISDGWGQKTLDRNYGKSILEEAAQRMTVSAADGIASVNYSPGVNPDDYYVEVRVYINSGGIYTECAKSDLSFAPVSCTGSDMRVLFTLRNLGNAKIEGALRVDISADGSVTYNDLFKPVI